MQTGDRREDTIARTPEPELMSEPAQAAAYAAADFDGPNSAFVEHVERALDGRPLAGRMLDLGCGPADICIRLAERHPALRIDALDGSAAMLEWARRTLAATPPELAARIRLLHEVLPSTALPPASYDLITSNSLLHHLHDPAVLWQTVRAAGRPGCTVVVMDLFRPCSTQAAAGIVERYAANEAQLLRTDFYNSLLAAFTMDEVRDQLHSAHLKHLRVAAVSDRHLLVTGRLD